MIQLKEGFGARPLAVCVPWWQDDNHALANLLASIDDSAEYAGGCERLLIHCGGPVKPREGWKMVSVDPGEGFSAWKEVAARHLGHCSWVYYHETAMLVAKPFVLDLLRAAGDGKETPRLVRLADDVTYPPAFDWSSGAPCDQIGVTIVTPGYEELAAEAVRRFKRFTGLPVLVIEADTKHGFEMKLRLPELVPHGPTTIFFDADWWMLRPGECPLPRGHEFMAVPDPQAHDEGSFCRQDAQTMFLDEGHYFNSGFMVFNAANFEPAFANLREQRATRKELVLKDTTDQSWINFAVETYGFFKPLPLEWNFYPLAWTWGCVRQFPGNVIGLHAAGVPLPQKLGFLQRWAAVLSDQTKPLLETVP
jgi:hypothetical protein